MPVIAVQPRGLTLEDWAAQLRIDVTDAVPVYGGGDWQEWARACLALDAFQKGGAPRPEGFANWQDWAERVFQALN